MKTLIEYLFSNKKQLREVGWFRRALYMFLIYKGLVYIYHFNEFFSDKSYIYHSVKHINAVIDFVYFLNNNYSVFLTIIFISTLFVCSIIGLIKKSNYISNALLWFVVINFTAFLYPTLTAGDYMLNQILLFNIFFSEYDSKKIVVNEFKIFFHNTSLIALKLQVCLGYFISGLYKIQDSSWLSGNAVYSTFQIPEFSNTLLASFPFFICLRLTYLTIIYQLSFPFLIWIRPLKIWLMLFGVTQHLVIAFGMGLFTFGIIMLLCYILFLKYDDGLSVEKEMF